MAAITREIVTFEIHLHQEKDITIARARDLVKTDILFSLGET